MHLGMNQKVLLCLYYRAQLFASPSTLAAISNHSCPVAVCETLTLLRYEAFEDVNLALTSFTKNSRRSYEAFSTAFVPLSAIARM
jgi:hypothetical protein